MEVNRCIRVDYLGFESGLRGPNSRNGVELEVRCNGSKLHLYRGFILFLSGQKWSLNGFDKLENSNKALFSNRPLAK